MKNLILITSMLTTVTSAFGKGFPEKEKRDVSAYNQVEAAISSDVILVVVVVIQC